MPSAFYSILLYWVSALVKVLLVNAIGHSTALWQLHSLGTTLHTLTCKRFAITLTPDASISYGCMLLYGGFGFVMYVFIYVVPGPLTFQ